MSKMGEIEKKKNRAFDIVLIWDSAWNGKGESPMILRSLNLTMHRIVGSLLLSYSALVWRCWECEKYLPMEKKGIKKKEKQMHVMVKRRQLWSWDPRFHYAHNNWQCLPFISLLFFKGFEDMKNICNGQCLPFITDCCA